MLVSRSEILVNFSRVEMSCNLFPAVNVNRYILEFRSCVNGNHAHEFYFPYELDTEYHIEISQSKENGEVIFRIQIENSTLKIEHSTINTEPSAILLFSKLCN